MKNVKMTVDGDKLTIEIDLTKDFGLSKTGKTSVVASTGGFAEVDGKPGLKLNLNLNRKAS